MYGTLKAEIDAGPLCTKQNLNHLFSLLHIYIVATSLVILTSSKKYSIHAAVYVGYSPTLFFGGSKSTKNSADLKMKLLLIFLSNKHSNESN